MEALSEAGLDVTLVSPNDTCCGVSARPRGTLPGLCHLGVPGASSASSYLPAVRGSALGLCPAVGVVVRACPPRSLGWDSGSSLVCILDTL